MRSEIKTGELIGTVSIKIIDLERYANINTANTAELQQALTVMGVDADDISVVSDSIQDWRGTAAAPRVAGAESDYYQSLTPPYYAKNAPIDDLSELLLVKGVTPEMYYGGSSSNSPAHAATTQARLRHGSRPGAGLSVRIERCFHAVSSGKININTGGCKRPANDSRRGRDHRRRGHPATRRAGRRGRHGGRHAIPESAGALQTAGLNPANAGQAANLLTTRSSTFEVQVTAQIGNISREFTAIILRNTGTDIQVVGFYWK